MEDVSSDCDRLSQPSAVQLNDVTVHLGTKDVLRSISLSIEQGGIYALLGPSGCGKTTLMRTLVGRLHPTANQNESRGTVSIFGQYSHAFGQLVGFMPQETALHATNTIEEEFFFYGRLVNMSTDKLRERSQFLIELLELPLGKKRISKLSGGQQRRVSFAIALIHQPKLLILDEPTVGVDPLLRRKIWQHLMEITSNGERTAIVTTHYIEEARQANKISFMRRGQLLETGRPTDLLLKHGKQTLEDVFLELCEERHVFEVQNHEREKEHGSKSANIVGKICQSCQTTLASCITKQRCCRAMRACGRPSFGRSLYALLVKDALKFERNPFMLVIHLLLPILQIALFCMCVGRKLTDIRIGFITREVIHSSTVTGLMLDKVNRDVIHLIKYQALRDAQSMFEKGHLSGIIDVGANFSRELFSKVEDCSFADENRYHDAQLSVFVDQTNRQMVYAIGEELLRVLRVVNLDFNLGFTMLSSNSNRSFFRLERLANDEIDFEFAFTYFMVPGIVVSVIFFMNVALTALSLVLEQSDGTQDRVWITGVKSNEIILSQMIIHTLVLFVQISIVLFTALVLFELPLRGSLALAFLLCMIQGLSGMTFGLVVSTIFTTEVNAHQVTMAIFYPVLLLSGIVWPLEGQPRWMRAVTEWLPMTKATEALRGVLLKGWGMKHLITQEAFLVTSIWTIGFLVLTLVIFNCRRL